MEWFTTTVLLSQLTAGEDGAWDRLVQRFEKPILMLAARAGFESDRAEDIVQETMLALIAGLREGSYSRDKGRLSGWLYGIARMKILQTKDSARRRKAEENAAAGPEADLWVDEKSLKDGWEGSWAQNALEQSLRYVRSEFDANTMAAFEAVSLGDEPAAEVAARLGMTSNAVSIAKHRVLTRLRKLRDEFEIL